MNLSNRQRKALKIVGFTVLALVVFVFALSWTFPYDRVKDRLIDALSAKYEVEIGDIKPGIMPGKMIIESMKLTTRPKKKGEKAAVIFLEKVEVDIGLFALLSKKLEVEVVARVPGGTLEVTLEESKAGRRIKAHTEGLALGMLPWVKEAVGLPMAGPLKLDANIWLPKNKWKDAEGEIHFTCTGCTVGDGKTKLSMSPTTTARKRRRSKNAAIFASAGITVPKLKLGIAEGKMVIKKGVGTIESFGAKSKDGWLKLTEAELKFADPVARSTMPGCLRFELSASLKEREKEFGNIGFMLPERSRQDDGSYAIPLKGRLEALRPNVRQRCKGGKDDTPDVRASRPTITIPKARPTRDATATGANAGSDSDDQRDTDDEDKPSITPVRGASGPSLSTDALRNATLKGKENEKEAEAAREAGEGETEGEADGEGDGEATDEGTEETEEGDEADEGGDAERTEGEAERVR